MQLGSRISRFAFSVCADLHEREVLQAEQRLLTFLTNKDRGRADAHPAIASWVQQVQESNKQRIAEIEARKIYKVASVCRALIIRLPSSARRRVKWTTRFRLNFLRTNLAQNHQPTWPTNDFAIAVPFEKSFPKPLLTDSIGVVAHIYYPDIAPEIRSHLNHIPGRVDLYLSTDSAVKQRRIRRVFATWSKGHVEVRVAPNRGRDVAPKLITFREVYDRHPLVLHLHGKKSLHETLLRMWRPYIFENLIGDERVISSILSAFEHDSRIGIIASDHYFPVKGNISWVRNLQLAEGLGRQMGVQITSNAPLEFPSGSMFWARSAALRPLLDLNLSADDFPPETGQEDATLAHAVERMYFYACEIAGLKWLKVCRPELAHERPKALVQVRDETDLADFLENKAGSLEIKRAL